MSEGKRLGGLSGYYLSRRIRDLILPPIPVYRDAVLQSVAPAFEGIDAKVEAFVAERIRTSLRAIRR